MKIVSFLSKLQNKNNIQGQKMISIEYYTILNWLYSDMMILFDIFFCEYNITLLKISFREGSETPAQLYKPIGTSIVRK